MKRRLKEYTCQFEYYSVLKKIEYFESLDGHTKYSPLKQKSTNTKHKLIKIKLIQNTN